jgi:hypothetical protein
MLLQYWPLTFGLKSATVNPKRLQGSTALMARLVLGFLRLFLILVRFLVLAFLILIRRLVIIIILVLILLGFLVFLLLFLRTTPNNNCNYY